MKKFLGIINVIVGLLITASSLLAGLAGWAHFGVFIIWYLTSIIIGIIVIKAGIEIIKNKSWPYIFFLFFYGGVTLIIAPVQEMGISPFSFIGIPGTICLFILTLITFALNIKTTIEPVEVVSSIYLRLTWMLNAIFGALYIFLSVFLWMNGAQGIQLLILGTLLNLTAFYLIYTLKTRPLFYFGISVLVASFLGIIGFLLLSLG